MDSTAPQNTLEGATAAVKSGNPIPVVGGEDGVGSSSSNIDFKSNDQKQFGNPSRQGLSSSSHYMSPAASGIGSLMREREHSVGAWSISSVGTGDSRGTPSPSVTRSASRRKGKAGTTTGRSGLSAPAMRKKKDKHSLALRSIREFLKGRSCYDCLPVSFRLVVLDTKLIVKPALDIMWQAGIVSAPLWQSSTEPTIPTNENVSVNDTSSAPASSSLASTTSRLTTQSGESSLEAERINSPNPISPSQTESQPSSNLLANSPSPMQKDSLSLIPPTNKTGFAGMFTVNDIIHLIQYYYQNSSYDNASQDVERFRLEMLREIEQSLDVPPPPLLSIDPLRPIFDACQLLMKTHARRLPLLDHDEQTGMDVVVSVLTQYRVLKFIAMNCRETAGLNKSIRSLRIGTYIASMRTGMTRSMTMSSAVSSSRRSSNAAVQTTLSPIPFSDAPSMSADPSVSSSVNTSSRVDSPALEESASRRSSNANSLEPLATATLDTTVFDAVHIFSEKGISGIPILDEEGYVVDLYETVDVIDLVRTNAYQSLDLTIRQALNRRSKDFPGVITCSPDDSLATIFALLRSRRVHRILILEPENDSIQQGPSGAIKIENDKGIQAAIASDVEAIGDNKSKQQTDEKSKGGGDDNTQQQAKDKSETLGEIQRRKRGKLVGILCLSDIMRYIIGENSLSTSNATNMRTGRVGGGIDSATNATASTTVSSVDQNEFTAIGGGGFLRPRQGSEEGGEALNFEGLPAMDSNNNNIINTTATPSTSTQPPSTRFDPNDMPPTIEEHVENVEQSTPPPPTPLSLPEDQTPTQEKSVESAVSGASAAAADQ